ncbi:unnamed protein product, partial [Sphacelaria rigidula]
RQQCVAERTDSMDSVCRATSRSHASRVGGVGDVKRPGERRHWCSTATVLIILAAAATLMLSTQQTLIDTGALLIMPWSYSMRSPAPADAAPLQRSRHVQNGFDDADRTATSGTTTTIRGAARSEFSANDGDFLFESRESRRREGRVADGRTVFAGDGQTRDSTGDGEANGGGRRLLRPEQKSRQQQQQQEAERPTKSSPAAILSRRLSGQETRDGEETLAAAAAAAAAAGAAVATDNGNDSRLKLEHDHAGVLPADAAVADGRVGGRLGDGSAVGDDSKRHQPAEDMGRAVDAEETSHRLAETSQVFGIENGDSAITAAEQPERGAHAVSRELQSLLETRISNHGMGGTLRDGRTRCFYDNDGHLRCYPGVFFFGTSKC